MSGGFVSVRGLDEVQRALAKLEPAPLKKVLQKASTAGSKALKPYVQAETPTRTGKMRKSVSATQARKERPAAIVKFRPRIAWYRAAVITGSRPHRIRFPDQVKAGVPRSYLKHGIKGGGNIRHPGNKANDVMGRAWSKGGKASLAAVDKSIHDYLETL